MDGTTLWFIETVASSVLGTMVFIVVCLLVAILILSYGEWK